MKMLHIANLPSPYRVDFWNELGKYIDLTVVCERKNASDRDSNWIADKVKNYNAFTCKGIKYGAEKIISFSTLKYIKKFKDSNIIIGNCYTITGIIEIIYMRIHHIPYWIEGDGAFPTNARGIKKKLKHFIYGNAVACISACQQQDEYYKECGVAESKILRYNFSSIWANQIVNGDSPCEHSVNNVDVDNVIGASVYDENRATHRLECLKILFVGQFIHRKGLDVLLEVARKIENKMLSANASIEFNLVGGETIDESLLGGKSIPSNVKISGFKNQQELSEIYLESDIFVLPTREDIWGLVVNEAMAKGLPIVTTDRCNAGLELVHDGENGFIVPAGDANALYECLTNMVDNEIASPGYLCGLGKKSLEYIKNYTIENMVQRHIEIFEGQSL